MSKQPVDVLVISLTSPVLIGLYQENKLIKNFQSEKKTSDILPHFFQEILSHYQCQNLYFARGPGSFMAIKITYVFLQTLAITRNLTLFATDGFYFNQNSPIKAIGSLYFIKENGNIHTEKIDITKMEILPFKLPMLLDKKIFTKETKPLYILPAV